MKIRNDYVSNSSSSSFIIAQNNIIESFNLTKEDILNALIDDYGVEAYKKTVDGRKKYAEEHPTWYDKEIKYQDFGPFFIYDLADESEMSQAIDMWGDLLSGWNATKTINKNGNVYIDSSANLNYNSIIRNLYDIYGVPTYSIEEYFITGEKPTMFIRSEKIDPETCLYGKAIPIPDYLFEFIKNIRKDCGVISNLEAIKSDISRFFVHADDNDIWGCRSSNAPQKNEKHPESEWESETYSMDRISEIVFKYLVKTGRIKIDDEKFMESVKISEKDLSSWDISNNRLYNLVNGQYLTWKDFNYFVMSAVMHEG